MTHPLALIRTLVSATRARSQRTDAERGAVAVLVAIFTVAAVGFAALAVDTGTISADKRDLNKLADVVALDTTRHLENRPAAHEVADRVARQAYLSAMQNGFDPEVGRSHELSFLLGVWAPDVDPDEETSDARPDFLVCARDAAGDYVASPPCHPNAVKIAMQDHSERVFAYWTDGRTLERTATSVHPFAGSGICTPGTPGCPLEEECDPGDPACPDPEPVCEETPCDPCTTVPCDPCVLGDPACPDPCTTCDPDPPTLFSGAGMVLGSFASRIDSSQFALYNAVLTELLNPAGDVGVPQVGITALGYDGLAGASLTMDELAAILGFGSPNELLDSTVDVRDMLTLMATAFAASGDPSQVAAAGALGQLALSTSTSLSHSAADLFDVEAGHEGAVGLATLNVLDLVVASAEVANTNNLLVLTLPTPPALISLGVSVANLQMSVIEAPRFVFGPAEMLNGDWVTTLSSSQVQFDYDLSVTLSPLLAAQLGTPVLQMPVYVDAFQADADLIRVLCDSERAAAADPLAADEVDVFAAVTGLNVAVGNLLGDITQDVDFPTDVGVGSIGTVLVPLQGLVNVGARNLVTVPGASTTLTYVPAYDDQNTQSVHGPDPTATDPIPVGSTVRSGLTFINRTTGAPLPAATQNLIRSALNPVLTELDSYAELVANGVGLTIGGADVTVNGIDCLANDPVIVSNN